MAGRIFISYRRADTANQAGWLADRLAGHFGRPQVVRDVDSIQLGNDFADVIAAAVTSCDVLLALIGHQWLAAAAGPDDFVRVEIEAALTRGVQVIPVLVDGARMPTAAQLPPSLALLAQRQALSLGAANPELDVSRLMQVLNQSIAERQATRGGLAQNQPTVTGMAPSWGSPPPSQPPPSQLPPGQLPPGQPAPAQSVTGYNGQNELARPSSAGSGLSGVTPLNLDVSVDVRTLSGAAQGYGLGLAFRGDGNGNLYAFLIEDHAVAIQKWVGDGARITGDPAPTSVNALHVGASGRLRAVATTIDGGQAVHLELWLNGKKLVGDTDRDHPYTRGYMGLHVESISDSPSTAAAEFDNFTAAQL